MLVHTDPKLQKAIILSFPRDLWVNIPGRRLRQDQRRVRGRGRRRRRRSWWPRPCSNSPGSRSTTCLYVDLAGFQGVVETLGGVDMCIPAENVNTPGYVEGEHGSIYYPRARLHRRPAHRARRASRAARRSRRTRRSPTCGRATCRATRAAPDFYRIGRQQQFLRAVINRAPAARRAREAPAARSSPILVEPAARRRAQPRRPRLPRGAAARASAPVRSSSARCPGTAGHERRSRGASRWTRRRTRSSGRSARASRSATSGAVLVNTPPSEANIAVPVVDHASGGKVDGVEQILSDAGFDIAPGVVTYDALRCDGARQRDRLRARARGRGRGRAEVLPEPRRSRRSRACPTTSRSS